MNISKELSVNKSYLESVMEHCADVHFREYTLNPFGMCLVVYVETTINTFDLSDLKELTDMDEAIRTLLAGNVVLFCQGKNIA